MKVTPIFGSDRVKVEIDYDSPGGRVAVAYLSSAGARAIAEELVRAANWVCHNEKKPDLSGVHDTDCAKFGCEGHRKPEVYISIDMDEVNRQLANASIGFRKPGWNKRKQQEHERDEEKKLYGTVRVKPEAVRSFDEETHVTKKGPYITHVDLGPTEAAAVAAVLKCAKCGEDQHDGWCWL